MTSIEPNLRLVARSDPRLPGAQLDSFVVKPNVSHAGSGGVRCTKPKGKWKAR
jgi:hypothetical protein